LSGGEQQRVAIGRCIVRDPHVFLMDEPISNLDAKLRERTRIEIKKMLRKFDVTTVYVTHDQQEAIFMGDRIAVMRKGKLEQIGSYDELYYTPANLFVATFIGTPPMNIVPLKCAVDTLVLQGATSAAVDQIIWTVPPEVAPALDGRSRVRMGVRAEGWIVDDPHGVPMPVRYVERIPTEQAAFLHGTLEGVNVTILVPLDYPETHSVRVMPKWDAVYFFDEKEETALHTPGVPDLDLF
ncbi:MAG: ATP-binding cassette domain-containing protein, partial [Anaerolinea sp.]|nr:ATP-binding cassette domain-containing protein [Anaerolinea sp.]